MDMFQQTENCVASTSNANTASTAELENGSEKDSSNNRIRECDEIFKELIEKCYRNTNFPKLNIEVIENLYKSLPSEFVGSKFFVKLLRKVNRLIWPDSGSTYYIHIEHIYDQLQQFKTSMKIQDSKKSVNNKELNEKTIQQIKKLKTALKKVREKIKNLDKNEMDINNDDEFNSDSAYIIKDKYEKRIVEIYKRMCKLRDEPDFLKEPILRFRATNDSLINKTIEKYYNLHNTFPDYFEIYTLLKCLRDKKNLKWTETELKNISHDAFLKLGKQLKLRRLNEFFGNLADINTLKDPAEENEELKKKLDESNKKLLSDLNELTQKFKNKQDYAEETEGSNLNNTECENSSENECTENTKKSNKQIKYPIIYKRKRLSSPESENYKPVKKCQKTIYMESIGLVPSSVTLEKIQNGTNEKTSDNNAEKVLNGMTTIDNVNDMKNKKNSINIVKDAADKAQKNINDIVSKSNDKTSGINKKAFNEIIVIDADDTSNKKNKITKKVSEKISKNFTESVMNTVETLGNNNLVIFHNSLADTDADGILLIDDDDRVGVNTNGAATKEAQECKIREGDSKDAIPIDSEDYDSIIFEPEVIIHEGKDSTKDVIDINEFDDSDVEITSCETFIVPVQNKKSLETIIRNMKSKSKGSFPVLPRTLHQNSSNSNQNLNNTLVNHWVMNNIRPPKPNSTKSLPNLRHNNRQPMTCQRMQSTSFQKGVQTARQVTQHTSNAVQQQRNFNNQSMLRKLLTTTTTVGQIVQTNQVHCPGNSTTNNGKKPEII